MARPGRLMGHEVGYLQRVPPPLPAVWKQGGQQSPLASASRAMLSKHLCFYALKSVVLGLSQPELNEIHLGAELGPDPLTGASPGGTVNVFKVEIM